MSREWRVDDIHMLHDVTYAYAFMRGRSALFRLKSRAANAAALLINFDLEVRWHKAHSNVIEQAMRLSE